MNKKRIYLAQASCICSLFVFLQFNSKAQLDWGTVKAQLKGSVTTIIKDTNTNKLYVGGNVHLVDGLVTPGVAVYDQFNQWHPVGAGINSAVNTVYAMAIYRDTLIIGGNYGLDPLQYWNGTEWKTYGDTAIDGVIFDLKVIDNELWVAGGFDSIGNIQAEGIAIWDGSKWKSAYDFPNTFNDGSNVNRVVAIEEYKGEIFIGGNLQGDTLAEIARWDGTSWRSVGGGIKEHGFAGVNKLIIFRDELYVIGRWITEVGNVDNGIMRWNGEEWLRCGGGLQGSNGGYDAVVYDDKLWVTGGMKTAGGVEVNGLAIWDGEQWCSPGNEFSGWPAGIAVFRDTLYMGGNFETIDGDTFMHLATHYRGQGSFDSCGVLWPVGIEQEHIKESIVEVFPNPTSSFSTISTNFLIQEIDILNTQGVLIKQHLGLNTSMYDIQLDGLPNGLYFLRIKTKNESVTKKILKTTN